MQIIFRGGGAQGGANWQSGLKVNVIGDSITSADVTTKTWHAYLKEMLGFSLVRNYGVSGSPISDFNSSNQSIVDRISAMHLDADLIIMFAGTNDWGWTSTPLGGPLFTDVSGTMTPPSGTDTFYGALHSCAQQLMARYPGKMIVWCTPIHRAPDSAGHTESSLVSKDNGDASPVFLYQYVDAMIEVGGYYGIPVCDLYRLSGINPHIAECASLYFNGTDYVHPIAAGHKRIADIVGSFIMATFAGKFTDLPDAPAPTNASLKGTYAIDFSNTSQSRRFVEIPASVMNEESYTKIAYIYTGDISITGNSYNIISSYDAAFWIDEGILRSGHNGDYHSQSSPAVSPNTWYHVALTYDGTNLITYLDGSEAQSRPEPAIPDQIRVLIGGYPEDATTELFPFVGWIAGVWMYNRALTPSEIAEHAGGSIPTSGLVGEYKFEEGSGLPQDTSGNGNHATAMLGVTYKNVSNL